MKTPIHYIATWFYKESKEEASFYPQVGGAGDSELVHSIYMQIQVPFFTTFKHYNPNVKMLFFTNVEKLPAYLEALFARQNVEVVRLPYRCIPPQGWYPAWRNQFYLYDIWQYMGQRMQDDDNLLVCDADCLCTTSLDPLFADVTAHGSALYELTSDQTKSINGISLADMTKLYEDCYGQKPSREIAYYGGEFFALRGDIVKEVNNAYRPLWDYNLRLFAENCPRKLNEEALFFSILAERLNIRNTIGNKYIKRLWTTPTYNNVVPSDEQLAIWHLPYEKKRGLYYLFLHLQKHPSIDHEEDFRRRASFYTGVPVVSLRKKTKDFCNAIIRKLKL